MITCEKSGDSPNIIHAIIHHLESLPESARYEVLDYIEFLKSRRKKEEENDRWSEFSLASAMRGMEDEESIYSSEDIIEPCE